MTFVDELPGQVDDFPMETRSRVSRFAAAGHYSAGLRFLKGTIDLRLQSVGANMGDGSVRHADWDGSDELPRLLKFRVVPYNAATLTASFTPEEILSCAGGVACASVTAKVEDLINQFQKYRANIPRFAQP